jgi:phosphatidate cytidylyltransferase
MNASRSLCLVLAFRVRVVLSFFLSFFLTSFSLSFSAAKRNKSRDDSEDDTFETVPPGVRGVNFRKVVPHVRSARGGGSKNDIAERQSGSPKGAKKLARNISNKWSSFRARTASGLILGAAGLITLFHGAMATMVMIFAVQTLMMKELFDLSESQEKAKMESAGMRFRLQKWYFYFCAAFTLYGRMGRHFYLASLAEKGHFFVDETTKFARIMTWVIVHHSFISYSLYMGGFVTFVLLLRKGLFKYQFSQFAWTHITIAIIFLQSSATISNIFEGMIWFLFPFLLVVVNDVMAYVFGKAFGRTPLIALSPKKTWEGFLGAMFCTVAMAPILSTYLGKFRFLTCPPMRKTMWKTSKKYGLITMIDKYFSREAVCELRHPFIPMKFNIDDVPMVPFGMKMFLRLLLRFVYNRDYLVLTWFDIHAGFLALFASIVAPFGGFFASGFKRAFKIDDFGHTIPGHGGFVDRMDVQTIMAAFVHFYIRNFVELSSSLGTGRLLGKIELMNDEDLVTVLTGIKRLAGDRGLDIMELLMHNGAGNM